jgi:uncharacterized protein
MAIRPVLSLVTLGVTDLKRSTAFYQALGWPLSSASVPGEVSFFRTAGSILALWGADNLAEDSRQQPIALGPGFRGYAVAINLGSPEEVDTAFADVEAAGGTVLNAPHTADWGGYSGYFADPDGHAWEVAHNPSWPLDDKGLPTLPE